MENIVEIYWYDLPEAKQRELLDAGFVDGNVMNGTFPLTEICIYDEEQEEFDLRSVVDLLEERADLIYEYETKIAKAKRDNDTEAQYYYQDKLDELLREDDMNGSLTNKKEELNNE